MRVQNRKIIRHLSWQTFKASRKKNAIAVCAIALTAILFTALFTVFLSVTKSYEQYQMRQRGGYVMGTFNNVTEEQVQALQKTGRARALGERVVIGSSTDGVFTKVPAEISWMDSNIEKWSYITYEEGHAPAQKNEIAMDQKALSLLGVTPRIGEKITLTYSVIDKDNVYGTRKDTFVLCGWWKYDTLSPAHYLNVSQSYVKQIEAAYQGEGADFRTDLGVIFYTSIGIRHNMQKMVEGIGCQSTNENEADYLSYGVNPGYILAGTEASPDLQTPIAVAAFLFLIIFTGYLIIYNIFRISVQEDVRYYGLLKTIGVTPRQLRSLIRQQAGILCLFGIPAGLLIGYGLGTLLLPKILSIAAIPVTAALSTSPLIFVIAAAFSVLTVLLSCARPAKTVSRISPVDAAKYTDATVRVKRRKKTKGSSLSQMARANLTRSRGKTALVIVSLSLAVVLFSVLLSLISGFDMQKYLDQKTCSDFIVGTTKYFRYEADQDSGLSQDVVQSVKSNTTAKTSGQAWSLPQNPIEWVTEDRLKQWMVDIPAEDQENHPGLYGCDLQVEGMDTDLLGKLKVVDGDLSALKDSTKHAVAIVLQTDDYGNIIPSGDGENEGNNENEGSAGNASESGDGNQSQKDVLKSYPHLGDTISLTYVKEADFIDPATGKETDPSTAGSDVQYHIISGTDQTYTVAALVILPYAISERYSIPSGDQIIMSADQLRSDSGEDLKSLFYAFDSPNAKEEAEAEQYLSRLTRSDTSEVMYESKETVRREFSNFRNMFLLVGLVLCITIGVIGILNYFNTILTGILSRSHEFAVLQAIGMTGRQLRQMLILEGVYYALGAIALSSILSLLICPLVGSMLEGMFYFYQYHFSLLAIGITAPVFLLIGILLPTGICHRVSKQSIVERLRTDA
ncbi:MAG: ABC transporter permease [Bilifractor sp.]